MTNIVFMGTPDFSTGILTALHSRYNILAVVTQPDKPVGRKKIMTPPPVKKTAEELGIKVLQPAKLTGSSEMQEIIDMAPDLIVTAAYGQLLPEALLTAPALGAINVHASLLPKYRGGAPIHYSILKGEAETGVTIMYMEKRLDAGNIISQRSIKIEEDDTTGTLHDKLSELGTALLMDTMPDIIAKKNDSIVQDEEKATYSPNISRADEFVSFDRPSREIYNHIRGLAPWPVAYGELDGQVMKLHKAQIAEGSGKPGEIIKADKNGILVATADGAVLLTEVQPAGKKKMSAGSYISGLKESLEGQVFTCSKMSEQ